MHGELGKKQKNSEIRAAFCKKVPEESQNLSYKVSDVVWHSIPIF